MLSPVWAHARPLRIVVAVMADIRAGVEAKTAVEDLSAKSFPRYGKVGSGLGLWVGLELG